MLGVLDSPGSLVFQERRKSSGGESGGDRLDGLALLFGHLVRDPQAYRHQEVARSLGGTDAPAANPKRATVGGAGRYPGPDRRPVEGRDVDLGPQHGLGPADLGLDGQVPAPPAKDRVRPTRTTA